MNLESIEKKLNQIKNDLGNNNENKIINNIREHPLFKKLDEDEINQINNDYYSSLSRHEKEYQEKNDKYKELVSQFSKEYLELTEFYVGPELPREHYLQSKKDVIELYILFAFFSLWEPYINIFYDKMNYEVD